MPSKTDQLVTDTAHRLADMIEAGAGEWLRPWTLAGTGGFLDPRNATTGGGYRGLNILRLAVASDDNGYASHQWATYKQWESIGAQVRKGERGTAAIKWVTPKRTKNDATNEPGQVVAEWTAPGATPGAPLASLNRPRLVPVAFYLFAAEQVDGYTIPEPAAQQWENLTAAEHYIAATGAHIEHGGNSASCAMVADRIRMPHRGQFPTAGAYYATLLHELIHWTRHETRTGRSYAQGNTEADRYAWEELTAELGAATLCARFGIPSDTRSDHAAYLAHWARALRETPKALVKIASKVADAVDHLDTYQPTEQQQAA